jgi:biopolymer transport protein ExbD
VNSEKKTSITEQPFVVNIGITEDGKYKWITEVNEFIMGTTGSIQKELQKQQQMGLISKNPEHTKILLHIDRNAKWEPVAQAIFALREQGFPVHPVYEPLDP